MNIFEFLTICPPEIKAFLLSDVPNKVLINLEIDYRLTPNEGRQLTGLTRDILLGLEAVENLNKRIEKIISRQPEISNSLASDYRKKIIEPNIKYLKQSAAEVQEFKQKNNLPEIVIFDVPKPPSAPRSNPTGGSSARPVVPAVSRRPIPTTSDIRRPIKRPVPPPVPAPVAPKKVIPPATPVKPAPPVASKPKLDEFQLRTVDDLINVPAATLQKEPDDEKKLVGRFKQEIQDIANHSGAKRTEIVAGWKKSQIYQAYIEMGNDSIQQGKPIGDVMAFRKAAGKPYLTENQFHAVSEISRLLLR